MKEYQVGAIRAAEQEAVCEGRGPDFLTEEATGPAYRFHQTLENYQPTPLVRLDGLARRLGVRAVFVKDESHRFGLNAFKGLGGIYALSRTVAQKLGMDPAALRFSDLQTPAVREKLRTMVFVTATDGNHGKGVAWAAKQLGCVSHVYLPAGSSEARAQAIRDAGGAQVRILDLGYDDAVRYAARMAKENGWQLVQDTSWPDYEEIPTWIVQGYTTMAREAADQLDQAGETPTHVFLQAGVGAMAGGVLGYLMNRYEGNRPVCSIVEPEAIPCIYASARAGDGTPHTAPADGETIMAGLNCGEPCTLTWPVLRDFASWYFACPDWVAEDGMIRLGRPVEGDAPVVSGESGGVTAGLLCHLASDANLNHLRMKMGLNEQSVVLLFSTEGDTDPEHYRAVLEGGGTEAVH